MWKFHRNPVPTNAGSSVHLIRQGRYAADGSVELYVVEQIDVQDKINSHRYECDLDRILAQLRAGDTSVVNRKRSVYGSFENFPTNYADILNSLADAHYTFDRMSADQKKAFDNDFNKWFSSVGSPVWMNSMGFVEPAPTVPLESVVDKEVNHES